MAPLEGLQAAQPGDRLPAGQAGHRRGGMQGLRQGQGLVGPAERWIQPGRDRRVQVHEGSVAGQARVAGAPRRQARPLQHRRDRFHHQLVFVAVLGGAQQLGRRVPQRGRAGEGIAAQQTLAQGEQAFRGGPQQSITPLLLPEEAAAAGLAAAQVGKHGQGIEGAIQLQLLAHRQHQLGEVAPLHQLDGPLHRGAVTAVPAAAMPDAHGRRAAARIGKAGDGFEPASLLPQLLGHAAGGDAAPKGALQPQPGLAPLPGQLPAGQHRLHPSRTAALLQRAVEEGEGQQHPRPRQGGQPEGRRGGQAAQAGAAEALSQLEAAGAAQLQGIAAARGGQA